MYKSHWLKAQFGFAGFINNKSLKKCPMFRNFGKIKLQSGHFIITNSLKWHVGIQIKRILTKTRTLLKLFFCKRDIQTMY